MEVQIINGQNPPLVTGPLKCAGDMSASFFIESNDCAAWLQHMTTVLNRVNPQLEPPHVQESHAYMTECCEALNKARLTK